MNPLVSVIIPTYNYGHFLPHTLQNVLELQNVTTDIIVVDDGSTDKTAEVVKRYGDGVRYFYQEHKGPSAARNTGMAHARGEFMVFLDADDLLSPDTLRIQAQTLHQTPDAHIALCYNEKFCSETPEGPHIPGDFFPMPRSSFYAFLCKSNIAPIHAHMVRSDAARRVGGFDAELSSLEDYDFWLRCAAAGCGFALSPGGVALYRRHATSLSADKSRMHMFEFAMRTKIHELLQQHGDFAADQRPAAWLAHAGRCFQLMGNSMENDPARKQDLLDRGVSALKAMVKELPSGKDACATDERLAPHMRYFGLYALGQLDVIAKKGNPDEAVFSRNLLLRAFPGLAGSGRKRFIMYEETRAAVFAPSLYISDFTTWATAWMRIVPKPS